MQANEIYEKLKAEYGDAIMELVSDEATEAWIRISPDKILEVCLGLRDDNGFKFDYLANLSGMDYKDSIGVVYHLYSVELKHRITLKAILDRENPTIHTVERVWKTANWHEREAFDMFGIIFENHPNLIRILSPYDWEGYPLRKDYVTPQEYNGLKVPY